MIIIYGVIGFILQKHLIGMILIATSPMLIFAWAVYYDINILKEFVDNFKSNK